MFVSLIDLLLTSGAIAPLFHVRKYMTLKDLNGNVIQEDLKTTEGLLAYVRNRKSVTSIEGITGDSGNVSGTIQSSTVERDRETQSNNGGIESSFNRERSKDTGNSTVTNDSKQSTRRDSSLYQYDGRTATGHTTFTERLKTSLNPFYEVVEKRKKEAKKTSVKKTEYKKLSDNEVLKLRPKTIDFIMWSSEHLDQFIQATTKGHMSVVIWSNLDKDDCEVLADYLISKGKTNEKTAQLVRNISELSDNIKRMVIVLPRTYQTALIYFKRGVSLR